jgi:hypothetical protein
MMLKNLKENLLQMNNKHSMKPLRMVKASLTPIKMLINKNMMKKENKLNKSVIQSSRKLWIIKVELLLMNKNKISMMNFDLFVNYKIFSIFFYLYNFN